MRGGQGTDTVITMDTERDSGQDIMQGTVPGVFTARGDTIQDLVEGRARGKDAHRPFRQGGEQDPQHDLRQDHQIVFIVGRKTARAIPFHNSRQAATHRELPRDNPTMSTPTGTEMCSGRQTAAGSNGRCY